MIGMGRLSSISLLTFLLAACVTTQSDKGFIDGRDAKVYFAVFAASKDGMPWKHEYGEFELTNMGPKSNPILLKTRSVDKPSWTYVPAGSYKIGKFKFYNVGLFGDFGSFKVDGGDIVYLGHITPTLKLVPPQYYYELGMTEESDIDKFLTMIKHENPGLESRVRYIPLRSGVIRPATAPNSISTKPATP